MTLSILNKIAEQHYVATADLIEELSRQYSIAFDRRENTLGTYLSVLVATAQQHAKENNTDAAYAITATHNLFYPAILKGLESAGVKKDMLQSRATFARTAKTTVMRYVVAGGDFFAINPAEVTKAKLRELYAEPRTGDLPEKLIAKSGEVILEVVRKLAEKNIHDARRELIKAIDMLTAELDKLDQQEDDDEDTPRITGHSLHRTQPNGQQPSQA